MNQFEKQASKYLNDTQFGKLDIHFRKQISLRELAPWIMNTESLIVNRANKVITYILYQVKREVTAVTCSNLAFHLIQDVRDNLIDPIHH